MDQIDTQSPRRSIQFSIRGLLVLTTIIGLCSAMAVQVGIGSVPLALGLTTGAAQAWFRPDLSPSQRFWLHLAGMVLFVASFLMPSVSVLGTVYGWQAGLVALQALPELVFSSDSELAMWLVWPGCNLANLLMISSPFWVRGERMRRVTLVIFAAAAGTCWSIGCLENMMIGYLVWCSSFLLLLIAWGTSRLAFSVLVTFPVLFLLAHWLEEVIRQDESPASMIPAHFF